MDQPPVAQPPQEPPPQDLAQLLEERYLIHINAEAAYSKVLTKKTTKAVEREAAFARKTTTMERLVLVIDQIKNQTMLVLNTVGEATTFAALLPHHFADIGQLRTVAIGAAAGDGATKRQMRRILIEAGLTPNDDTFRFVA